MNILRASSQADIRERVLSAMLSAALVGLLGWALAVGLGVRMPGRAEEALDVFDVLPAPPPPPVRVVPEKKRDRREEGEAAPPNLRSQATQIVAPVPVVILPMPSPVITVPVAGLGSDRSQGAALLPGPGTGAGGVGDGTGSGGKGDGDGGGWDDTPPRRVRGRIRDSDYPDAAADAGASGTVSVRYFVEVNGRATGCRVTGSSGNAALDTVTCRLIERRFRYDPSRDGAGRPVRSIMTVDHDWRLERVPDEDAGR